jgi:hypothetical protein
MKLDKIFVIWMQCYGILCCAWNPWIMSSIMFTITNSQVFYLLAINIIIVLSLSNSVEGHALPEITDSR